MTAPFPRRLPPTTTLCRILASLALMVAGTATATTMDEAEVVRSYLAGPVASANLAASDADSRAARTAPPLFDNPSLEARHEEARGVAGTTTDAIGGSVAIDLGLAGLQDQRTARRRGDAADWRRTATAVDGICGVRRHTVDLWAATQADTVTLAADARLDELVATLGALALAGEASGFDRDRAALEVSAHHLVTATRQGEIETLRARLTSLTGEHITDVRLAPIAPLPPLEAVSALVSSQAEVSAVRLDLYAAQSEESAARRRALPDIELAAGARWDAPPDGGPSTQGFEIGGGIEVPLFDWSKRDVRVATAERAQADAELGEPQSRVQTAIEGAWHRASALSDTHDEAVDPEAIWHSATERYAADETSLDDLLQTAEAVEGALLADVELTRRLRHARLDLSCAIGRFDEPAIQTALEESLR